MGSNLPSPPSGLVDKGQGDHLVLPEWGRGPKGPRRAALWRQREPAGSNCITLFHRPPLVSPPPKPQSWQQAGPRRSRPNNLGRREASRRREQQGYLRVKRVALPFSGHFWSGPAATSGWMEFRAGHALSPAEGLQPVLGHGAPPRQQCAAWLEVLCLCKCVSGRRTHMHAMKSCTRQAHQPHVVAPE